MIAAYDSGSDSFSATNSCILAPHLFTSEIIALAYQQEPNRILWVLLEEGKLLGLTYDAEQNITGWHEHATGGAVESIKVIPDIDGGRDELWMVVRRTINGATVRYLNICCRNMTARLSPRNGRECWIVWRHTTVLRQRSFPGWGFWKGRRWQS
jgi:hypothetical protein